MPNRFCAICGKSIGTESPHFGMCYECYLHENPLFVLPEKFLLKICPDCLNYSKKNNWLEPKKRDVFEIVREALYKFLLKPYLKNGKVEFFINFDEESFKFSSKDLLKSMNAAINGFLLVNSKIRNQEIIKTNIEYELCENCLKIRGGMYYLAIIQLRVSKRDKFQLIEKVLKEIQEYTEKIFDENPKHYITKLVDQKFGVDLYLSTNELMKYIISYLRGKYKFLLKRSKKLVGRDNQRGKNIYRHKTLVKFLPFEQNDDIMIENEVYTVDTILKNKVILRNTKNEKITKDYDFFFK
ncbi:MAG: hypothetical protein GF317_17775 [Candidatus Lokiarchaeota archaeon]|nr:hypothetical protein [Candidatus Lokiarchaeota archaeon]MBD3201362.1 hypothetical protein [Candidatus Lokiarchaeota archaeon]